MSVYNECPYCLCHYKPQDGDHTCDAARLKERIEELEERIEDLERFYLEPEKSEEGS